MKWHRVYIAANEPRTAQQSATALLEKLGKAYRDANVPDGVEVWHMDIGQAQHFYYLLPKAAELALPFLGKYPVQQYTEKPNLSGFKKLDL